MPPSTSPLRVLIVAGDPLVRSGLASILSNHPRCTVVGQVSGEDSLASDIDVYRPEVILWDVGWNSKSSLERLSSIQDPTLPPVVAMLPGPAQASEARLAGARGLLLRDADADTLVVALQAVSQGLLVTSPELSAAVPSTRGRPPAIPEDLTPRELEVLRLLAEGLPNKSIAQRLGITEHTVKFHINAIMGKLGAQSRTEAVVLATRMGIIPL